LRGISNPPHWLAFPIDISNRDECFGLMVEIVAQQNKQWRDRQIEILDQAQFKLRHHRLLRELKPLDLILVAS
jgi:hypothetical protein